MRLRSRWQSQATHSARMCSWATTAATSTIALLSSVLLCGCSSDTDSNTNANDIGNAYGAESPSCCDAADFQPGRTVGDGIGGSARSRITVQAAADFAGASNLLVEDITSACRNIARELDASQQDQAEAEERAYGGKVERADAWCKLAMSQVNSFAAGGSVEFIRDSMDYAPISTMTTLACLQECAVDAACDILASAPTCEYGDISQSCFGQCISGIRNGVYCQGICDGECISHCTTFGDDGVHCKGMCDGVCLASPGGSGDGIHVDGTCDGICKGTCSVIAPDAICNGWCGGYCLGSCNYVYEDGQLVPAQCDGECDAEVAPISCRRGSVRSNCDTDAVCQLSCDTSAEANVEWIVKLVDVEVTGVSSTWKKARLRSTLLANFGRIMAAHAKLHTMDKFGNDLAGNIPGIADIKPACHTVISATVQRAVDNVKKSSSVTGMTMDALSAWFDY